MTLAQSSTNEGPTQRLPRDAQQRKVESLDIVVLSGGPSAEREVSLESGKAVHEALLRLGHRSVIADIGPDNLSALDQRADFVFIALHGAFGEDGTVQAELDRRGIPYGGSGRDASHLAMDKVASKQRFEALDIPTPAYELVSSDTLAGLSGRFASPAVVKPVSSGSSVDTTIARTAEQLQRDAEAVSARYGAALVETFIDGPELTCAVLGGDALPVCEIRPAREFYDYTAKYHDDDTQYSFAPRVTDNTLAKVKAISLKAHEALGCAVFSRVDVMIDKDTEQPYVLEINTIPGFTGHSLVPKAAKRVGIDFDQLCQRIIELSLAERNGNANRKDG
ncbi:MAG: D-alanine--D-alanine ligase [Planctomycetota bacterium]|jgi:D-alanine-D-alanine ligase